MRHRASGLRPTIRQGMILVAWAAIVCAFVKALVAWRLLGRSTPVVCMMAPPLLGLFPMFLLDVMIRVLDEPGPVPCWNGVACRAFTSFVGGVMFVLQDPVCYALAGRTTGGYPLFMLLGVVCLCGGLKDIRAAWPDRCPECGRRAVVGLARPARAGSRIWIETGDQRSGCPACGAEFEGRRR